MPIKINCVIQASLISVQVDKQQHCFYDSVPIPFQQRYKLF